MDPLRYPAMSVRQWFREQRHTLWEGNGLYAGDLDRLVTKVLQGQPIDLVETVGTCKLVFNFMEWDKHQRLMDAIRNQLYRAMQELDREAARRAAVERIFFYECDGAEHVVPDLRTPAEDHQRGADGGGSGGFAGRPGPFDRNRRVGREGVDDRAWTTGIGPPWVRP